MPISSDHVSLDQLADEHLGRVLLAMAGEHASARDDQRTAVRGLLRPSARVLVVQATGWGKSAVYWAATSALRSLGRGPTIVVSPLLALMRDQVAAANRAGLRSAAINSTNVDDWDDVIAQVGNDNLDVLMISPERLSNDRFMARLGHLLISAGLIVIDEAHCISDWGFDFRPDYQRLSRVLTEASSTPVLATTATANARVTADVAAQMGDQTLVLRGSLARTSLRLSVIPELTALERYAWVDEALGLLIGSGIVYVPTVAETERLSDFLRSQGHRVAAYSGRLDPERRAEVEVELRANTLKAVVATSALGMGYDKPDLGFCIHVGSPDSPVAYYQQVGRAGRAIEHAEAVLLPAETDERLWEYFATASIPRPNDVTQVMALLNHAQEPMSVPGLEAASGIRRGRLEGLLKLLAVDEVVERSSQGWSTTGIDYLFDEDKWNGIRAARAAEADLMRAYAQGRGCLMEFLQIALDDLDPKACGRCSVCTQVVPAPGNRPNPEKVQAAQAFLRGRDVLIEPRKMWPPQTEGRRGRISGAMVGRALAFADDPSWHAAVSLASGSDVPVSTEVFEGLIDVLSRWRAVWGEPPTAVVPMPSRHHGVLLGDLAHRIGEAGNIEVLDILEVTGPAPSPDATSAVRVAQLLAGMSITVGAEVPAGPILLVDDRYSSGWTMTVAASMLRAAGANSVLPLVIHQLP